MSHLEVYDSILTIGGVAALVISFCAWVALLANIIFSAIHQRQIAKGDEVTTTGDLCTCATDFIVMTILFIALTFDVYATSYVTSNAREIAKQKYPDEVVSLSSLAEAEEEEVVLPSYSETIHVSAKVEKVWNSTTGGIYATIDAGEYGSFYALTTFGELRQKQEVEICYRASDTDTLYLYYDNTMHELQTRR